MLTLRLAEQHRWLCDLGTWLSWICNCRCISSGPGGKKGCPEGHVAHAAVHVHRDIFLEAEQEKQLQRCTVNTCESIECSPCILDAIDALDMFPYSLGASMLSKFFLGHEWETWRTCRLRVDEDLGAGLTLRPTRYGYLVEQVEGNPSQEDALQPGMVIVFIEDCSLVGLGEEELETTFARGFCSGALLHLLHESEMCAAAIQREAGALGEWHEESVAVNDDVMISVASPFLRQQQGQVDLPVKLQGKVPPDDFKILRADLSRLEGSLGLSLRCRIADDGNAGVTLHGDVTHICAALVELKKVLEQHGLVPVVEDELFIRMLKNDERQSLVEDLYVLGQRFGIVAELCCPPEGDDSIVLLGDPVRMREAILELEDVLHFYGILPSVSTKELQASSVSAIEDTMHEAEDEIEAMHE